MHEHDHDHDHDHGSHPHDHDHHHRAGREVHVHQPRSALMTELVTHLPLSTAGAALGLVIAGIICFLAPVDIESSVSEPAGVVSPAPHAEHDHDHDHASAGETHADDEHAHAASATDAAHAADVTALDPHAGHAHGSGFRPLFHLFHPLHMLFSAAATTAMFWRYDQRFVRAIIIGFIGAVGVCGLSDIIIPHAAVVLLGQQMAMHICVIEHPGMVLPFAAIGIGVGLIAAIGVTGSTFYSHSLHVFISTMASIFYMVHAYGRLEWIDQIGWLFVFLLIAVVGPCCFSDIIFPVAMTKTARQRYAESVCCH